VLVTAFHARVTEDVVPLGGEIIKVTGIVFEYQVPSLTMMLAL